MENKLKLNIILKKLSQDDKTALEQLFNYFYPRLYNFSKAFLKLEEGIDDILQEVFLKIWQNRKTIKNTETFIN
jgi:RNA polymerase sigma-70 factor (ECF subfamily)